MEGLQVTAEHNGKVLVRNKAQLKLLKICPERLNSKPRVGNSKLEDCNFDDDVINLPGTLPEMGASMK